MRKRKNETPYTETEVLLAIMNDDIEKTDRLLRDMLPYELTSFLRSANKLVFYITNAINGKYPLDY